jgi:hypothetical protein
VSQDIMTSSQCYGCKPTVAGPMSRDFKNTSATERSKGGQIVGRRYTFK